MIDVRHASKVYRRGVHALRDVSLRVAPGEIFGLLGPNGAGKSTLVKILMTVIRPTRVEGTLLGRAIGDKSALRGVGYLPEHLRFPVYLDGAQAIDYFGALGLVDADVRRTRAAHLLDLVGMKQWARHKIATYSKGMKQRLGLAVALIGDPDLVVLDEPTDGVDPVGRKEIRDVLLELRRRGKTVFVNSHLLGELEMICDRVAIMSKGTVIRQGTIEELTARSRRYEFTIMGDAPTGPDAEALLKRFAARIERTPDGLTAVEFATSDPLDVQPFIDLCRTQQRAIVSARPARQSLEDLFMTTIRDEGDKTPGAARTPAQSAKGAA
jgi:ABC-2 type transport system ATP-binding protein